MRIGKAVGLLIGVLVFAVGGCAATARSSSTGTSEAELRRRSVEALKSGLTYSANPVVRVQSVEALRWSGDEQALPWIRSALLDEHPAVRFAACVALGERSDRAGFSGVRRRLSDEDAGVRVAALFALHRLGETGQSGRISTYLLEHPDAAVRRNAAMVLGLLGEKSAIPMLARAMKDRDAGVRNYALEALNRLGNSEARQELSFLANCGMGADETFAIQALSALADAQLEDLFRHKLHNAAHVETRLAAARGLAQLGKREGYELALSSLQTTQHPGRDPQEETGAAALRIRQLAAAALAEMGRTEAVPTLGEVLEKSQDPRMQISAAHAILRIVEGRRGRLRAEALRGE